MAYGAMEGQTGAVHCMGMEKQPQHHRKKYTGGRPISKNVELSNFYRIGQING